MDVQGLHKASRLDRYQLYPPNLIKETSMKCLIGPHGLYFSRTFVDRLYTETGTIFFGDSLPKSGWSHSDEQFNAEEFLDRYDAIIEGDNLFFLDDMSLAFRTSPIVHDIVQELDQLAFKNTNSKAIWKIIAIPNDCTDFDIGSEYDGSEWIYEKHRTWK